MAAKKSTDVMIAGKVYTLSGYEEEGYLQRVASYINTKISEITEREEFRRIPNDMKSILIQLNIADDYFKARSQYEAAEENYKKAEKDLFELKHELVDTQMKVEELLEKLNRERQERNQKTNREQTLEEKYQKLSDKYQLLLNNAKISDEKNRQFEEMLHLTHQEKKELEAVNKELRLNKEKLEATLADALLGATKKENDGQKKPDDPAEQSEVSKAGLSSANDSIVNTSVDTDSSHTDEEDVLVPVQLSKEEVNELRDTIHTTMAELSKEGMDDTDNSSARAGLSEEELAELLAPVTPEDPKVADLSKEELAELFSIDRHLTLEEDFLNDDSENNDSEGTSAENKDEQLPSSNLKEVSGGDDPELLENEDEQLPSSALKEVSGEDDPELLEIARQIDEMDRQEQEEKIKKKDKKRQKRKR